MTLDQIISATLKEQNSIVLPNFGRLVVITSPTKISRSTDSAKPEHKKIVFSSNPSIKDDVLENQVIQLNRLDKKNAQKEILAFIKELKARLSSEGEVHIKGVGLFENKDNNQVLFTSKFEHNQTSAYFGLQEVQLKRISQEKLNEEKSNRVESITNHSTTKKEEIKQSIQKVKTKKESLNIKNKNPIKVLLLLIISTLLLALIVGYFYLESKAYEQEEKTRIEALKKFKEQNQTKNQTNL